MTDAKSLNPYFDARRTWNEVIGASSHRAKVMTALAAMLGVSNITLIAAMWHLSQQAKVVPYVVVLNEAMSPVSMGVAKDSDASDRKTLVRSFLARFIVDLRTVTVDASLLNRQFERLYTMLSAKTTAHTKISEYFREHNPFTRATRELVAINVVSLIATSDIAWEAEWVETTTIRNSSRQTKKTYRAVLTIGSATEQDGKAMLHNPLGIVIEQFEFSEKLV